MSAKLATLGLLKGILNKGYDVIICVHETKFYHVTLIIL